MTEVEKRAIVGALAYTRGDRAMAAQLLGIGRTTLYRKIKEYNLPLNHGRVGQWNSSRSPGNRCAKPILSPS